MLADLYELTTLMTEMVEFYREEKEFDTMNKYMGYIDELAIDIMKEEQEQLTA